MVAALPAFCDSLISMGNAKTRAVGVANYTGEIWETMFALFAVN